MVYLCVFCEHYKECVEGDSLATRCMRKNQLVHRYSVAGRSCFSDRRKSCAPCTGADRRKSRDPLLQR
jgi:hypothetical protein